MSYVDNVKIPTLFWASIVDTLDIMPISEKSTWPSILNAIHPSSISVQLFGSDLASQTIERSSSVFPINKNSSSKLIWEKSFTLHITNSLSIIFCLN